MSKVDLNVPDSLALQDDTMEKQTALGGIDKQAATAAEAQRAAMMEHSLGLMQAFKAYKKAIFWSVTVSMVIVMESYDTILLGSFYAYPTFQQQFGDQIGPNTYSVPPQWQTALSLGSSVGIIIGIYLNGFLVDRFGTKKVILGSLVVLTGLIGLIFAATSRGMLFAGQLLCGIPWGTLNVIAPAYAVETAPLALRHYTPTWVNECWVIGHIIGAGVLTGLVGRTDQWGWRIPFALQWIFPVPLFIICMFAPESPWWLARKGRHDDAVKALKRLSDDSVDHEQVVVLIEHTVELERQLNFGSTYAGCFKGIDRRRTVIAMIAWMAQTATGFTIQGYQSYFFTQAFVASTFASSTSLTGSGMAASDAFKLTLGTYCLAFIGTAISMPLQQRFRRRQVWLAGLCCMLPIMLVIGIVACIPTQTTTILWTQGALILVWFFCYGWSIGPLPYVICAEIGSAHLRQKTIALARGSYYVTQIINTIVAPYILNPTAGNLKGKAAFLPAALMAILLVWSIYKLPETKGRSFEELDVMFAKKVSARQFRHYEVKEEDEFADAKPHVSHHN